MKLKKRLTNKEYSARWYKEQRSIIRKQMHQKKLEYKVPDYYKKLDIPEKELTWIVSCIITQRFAVKTLEEVALSRRNRVDIYIPSHKIVVEVKVNGRRSKGSRPGETPHQQLARYKRARQVDDAFLVSIDGSIGYSIEGLLEKLEEVFNAKEN